MTLLIFSVRDAAHYYDNEDLDTQYLPQNAQSSVQNEVLYKSLTTHSTENRFTPEELIPGKIFNLKNSSGITLPQFYVVDTAVPFETTLQIVGKGKRFFIVQDITPDPAVHLGFVPHYEMHLADMYTIFSTLDTSAGRFQGQFKLRKRGGAISVGLA